VCQNVLCVFISFLTNNCQVLASLWYCYLNSSSKVRFLADRDKIVIDYAN
jgi:hypothetical protein